MGPYQEGSDFFVAAREPGSLSADLPIFGARKGVLRMEAPSPAPTSKKVPGAEETAFVLTNVLSKDECEQVIALTESMGYQEDAPVSLARNIRRNENCVWVTDDSITDAIFSRCAHLLPQSISLQTTGGAGLQLGPVTGLNNRWRLYKYGPEDIFKQHTDGAWPMSGIRDAKVVQDVHHGKQLSWLTFIMYLNDNFEGGATTLLLPSADGSLDRVSVDPAVGSVLCFYHGHHPLSPLHEGSVVVRGVKYVARSDVMYQMPPGVVA